MLEYSPYINRENFLLDERACFILIKTNLIFLKYIFFSLNSYWSRGLMIKIYDF